MTHTFHEATNHVWFDGCLECEARAAGLPESLGTLDHNKLLFAWRLMIAVRLQAKLGRGFLSECDGALVDCLYAINNFVERIGMRADEVEVCLAAAAVRGERLMEAHRDR